MKKIIILLMTLTMIMSIPSTAFAANTTISMTNTEARHGQVVYLTVSLADCKKADTLGITMKYDSTVLSRLASDCVWLKKGTMQDFDVAKNSGNWASSKAMDVNGDVCTLAFRVKAKAPIGDHKVECELTAMLDSKEIGTYIATGTVTVKCEHTYVNWTSKDQDVHMAVCEYCGLEKTSAHTWDEGKCLVCGLETEKTDAKPEDSEVSKPESGDSEIEKPEDSENENSSGNRPTSNGLINSVMDPDKDKPKPEETEKEEHTSTTTRPNGNSNQKPSQKPEQNSDTSSGISSSNRPSTDASNRPETDGSNSGSDSGQKPNWNSNQNSNGGSGISGLKPSTPGNISKPSTEQKPNWNTIIGSGTNNSKPETNNGNANLNSGVIENADDHNHDHDHEQETVHVEENVQAENNLWLCVLIVAVGLVGIICKKVKKK